MVKEVSLANHYDLVVSSEYDTHWMSNTKKKNKKKIDIIK